MIFHDIRKLNLKVGDRVHLNDGSKKENIMWVTMSRDNYFMLNNKKGYQANGIVYQELLSCIFHGDTKIIKRLLCGKIARITKT